MGSTVNSSSRINWIDTAKAISIFLVVLGHALSDGLLQSYVYAFHVPAFFFISGFFAKSSGGFLSFLKKRFCQIMIPYYIFGMLAILAYQIMGRFVADEVLTPIECLYGLAYGSVKTDCLKFNLHLWFLPAVFALQLIYYPINKLITSLSTKLKALFSLVLLAASFAVAYFINAASFSFVLPFGLDTAMLLFPFFTVGSFMSNFKPFSSNASNKAKALMVNIAGAAASFALFILLERQSLKLFPDGVNYTRDVLGDFKLFYLTAFMGIILVVFVSRALPDIKFILYTGQRTLPILVLHKFPLMVFSIIPAFNRFSDEHNIAYSLIVSVIAIMLCLLIDRFISSFLPFFYGKKR